jgi:hypothetical protein
MVPLTVARMTVVNLLKTARCCPALNGIAFFDGPEQFIPIAQQEEEQVEHDKQSDDEFERNLANIEGLRGKELAALRKTGEQPLLHLSEIRQSEAIQQTVRFASNCCVSMQCSRSDVKCQSPQFAMQEAAPRSCACAA